MMRGRCGVCSATTPLSGEDAAAQDWKDDSRYNPLLVFPASRTFPRSVFVHASCGCIPGVLPSWQLTEVLDDGVLGLGGEEDQSPNLATVENERKTPFDVPGSHIVVTRSQALRNVAAFFPRLPPSPESLDVALAAARCVCMPIRIRKSGMKRVASSQMPEINVSFFLLSDIMKMLSRTIPALIFRARQIERGVQINNKSGDEESRATKLPSMELIPGSLDERHQQTHQFLLDLKAGRRQTTLAELYLLGHLNEDSLVVRPHGLVGLTAGASVHERAALRDPDRVVGVRKSCTAYREGLLEEAQTRCSSASPHASTFTDASGASFKLYALRPEYRFPQRHKAGEKDDFGDEGTESSKKSQKTRRRKFIAGDSGDRCKAVARRIPLARRRRYGELGLLSLAVGTLGEAAASNGAPIAVKRRIDKKGNFVPGVETHPVQTTDISGLELGGIISAMLRGGNGSEVAVYVNSSGGSTRSADTMFGGQSTDYDAISKPVTKKKKAKLAKGKVVSSKSRGRRQGKKAETQQAISSTHSNALAAQIK